MVKYIETKKERKVITIKNIKQNKTEYIKHKRQSSSSSSKEKKSRICEYRTNGSYTDESIQYRPTIRSPKCVNFPI